MFEDKSIKAYQEACGFFPGGVNSPVRAFKNVGSHPFFVASGQGSQLTDLDGQTYIDYVLSWGPLIHGHAHPEVQAKVIDTLKKGWSYGAPTEIETELAQKVHSFYPSMEMMRFVSSGTEAVMSAIRLARGVTDRELILKCDGGYHGHSDGLLVSAGSGLATFGSSSSAGVPEAFASTTLVVPINDEVALEEAFTQYGDRIAAFILEPVSGNVGVIPPKKGYLEKARELTKKAESLLIFDEVMCGFRVSLGGAQSLYGVYPDITVLGKVIGGGFPVGAYGASRELMQNIAPIGSVYQAGTLSGNPVAMAAGLSTLEILENGAYQKAEKNTEQLCSGIKNLLEKKGLNYALNQVGTMFSLFLTEGPVCNYQDAAKVDSKLFSKFHRSMLEKGVYLAPSPFEASFMSSVHQESDLEKTLDAMSQSL